MGDGTGPSRETDTSSSAERRERLLIRRAALTRGAGVTGGLALGSWVAPVVASVDRTLTQPGTPVPLAGCRITGGGKVVFDIDDQPCLVEVRGQSFATHGFQLHCDPAELPNSLEVNWCKGNHWHMEQLTSAQCFDTSIDPAPPPHTTHDTYIGEGIGRYNGEPDALAQWTFTDSGEPGTADYLRLVVTRSNGEVVLNVQGLINGGNHQFHC